MPGTQIFTKTFFDVFVLLGGCGATLGLVFAILLVSRRRHIRRHVWISLIPSLFNINEILVFGIPIVFNPILIITFIVIPLVLTLITYASMVLGLVQLTIHQVTWTTPIILGGWAATDSCQGGVLQLFNLVLSILTFVGKSERKRQQRMSDILKNTVDRVAHLSNHSADSLLVRNDDLGQLCRP